MRAYERLIRYAKIHTASDDRSEDTPSTARQFDLAHLLAEELRALGAADVMVDEYCRVYGSLPATAGYENASRIGFVAHMDTVPDFSGENVQPRRIENYDGGDVVLGDSGRVLSPREFPHLAKLTGRTLIVTDGTTVLGADDKAGIAEIMTLIERVQAESIPHGKLSFCFTPDEEIGRGADHFNHERFAADWAYTMDGGMEGEVEYENFNADAAVVEITGCNVHPGTAKDTMKNALTMGMEFNAMLPAGEVPERTEGYEGFYHLHRYEGTVERVVMEYIIRDHDIRSFEARGKTLRLIEKLMNEKYGAGTVKLTIKEQYRNMAELIKPCFHLVENAVAAAKEAGVEPKVMPIRGGTDGARLSYEGLPCPNLGVGGFAYHGPYEHVSIEGMDAAVEIALGLVRRYAEMPRPE